MKPDTSKLTRPRTIGFGVPIALLLLLLAGLTVVLLRVAVQGQDRVALEASKTIARAAFNTEAESVKEIARDFSWRNAAVHNLIFDFNPAWAKDNLGRLTENYGVTGVFVFGPQRRPVYATFGEERVGSDHPAWRDADFLDTIDRARAQPDDPGATITAYVPFADGVYLVSASKLLRENENAADPPYPEKGILALTQKIDSGLVNRIETDFQLRGLALVTENPPPEDEAVLPLPGPTAQPVAHMTWNPPQPGTALLQWLGVPLTATLILVGAVIAMIVVRARRARLALQEALEAQINAHEQLEHMAHYDSLTGLPNRALFLEHLSTAIANKLRYGAGFTLHYLDLDGFKDVNDTYGHSVGDDLLQELAGRLHSVVRAVDTVARFGGDEFAVLQRGASNARDARLLAERLIHAVDKPFHVAGESARATLSVGITFELEPGDDAEAVVRKADRALYRAKRQGGNRLAFYVDDRDPNVIPAGPAPDRIADSAGSRH